MKTIERIKKECKNKNLDVETVLYNMASIENYRYKNNKLYYSKVSVGGKISFFKGWTKEVQLEDYQ